MVKNNITIEVALAFPKEQQLIQISIEEGSGIRQAIKSSNIFNKFSYVPDDVKQLAHGIGIFGKEIKEIDSYVLQDGDRIEIYRALTIDPKEARITRANKINSKNI